MGSNEIIQSRQLTDRGVIATMEEESSVASATTKNSSLIIVVVSLLFVAIFGGALFGGVFSGDPTNTFFITIIVASGLAVVAALGVSIRYYLVNRTNGDEVDEHLSPKEDKNIILIGRTLTVNSDEGNQRDDFCLDTIQEYHSAKYSNINRSMEQIDSSIREIHAKSICCEMSALSLRTYDEESLFTLGLSRHDLLHTLSNQSASVSGQKRREDPPEGKGPTQFQSAWTISRGQSQDPSAPKFSTDGIIIADDDRTNDEIESRSSNGVSSTGVEEDEKIISIGDDFTTSKQGVLNSNIEIPSSNNNRSSDLKSQKSGMKVVQLKAIEKKKITQASSIPTSTKSCTVNTIKMSSFLPTTPAASEVGSLTSNFFGIFGNLKKTISENGIPNHSNSFVEKNSTPLPPPPPHRSQQQLKKGRLPFNPIIASSNKSSFSIPLPRRLPPTPIGIETFSDTQSTAGSAYASSAFDEQAHQRALQKLHKKNQSTLGANSLGGNTMPMYYEDDDDDRKETATRSDDDLPPNNLTYDVFAPPGALGIVVDSNERGCIIHSLKKSSPMIGMMNRGDLIIAVDDFDVQNMSAASLTKLMASKAQQTERKFTLVNLK